VLARCSAALGGPDPVTIPDTQPGTSHDAAMIMAQWHPASDSGTPIGFRL
jgi:hypothetical protein